MVRIVAEAIVIARVRERIKQSTPPDVNDCAYILAILDRMAEERHQARVVVETARILEPAYEQVVTQLNQVMNGLNAAGLYVYPLATTQPESTTTQPEPTWGVRWGTGEEEQFSTLSEAIEGALFQVLTMQAQHI